MNNRQIHYFIYTILEFSQISCNLICSFKIVNIPATTQNFVVALFNKISPVQNTTIIAENTKNSLHLVPHTIEITIQIGEKFSPIAIKNLAFSQVPWLLSYHYYKLFLCKVSKGTINCS